MTLVVNDTFDVRYVRANFATLAQIAARYGTAEELLRSRVASRELPNAAYATADGTMYFPHDLVDLAIARDEFVRRYRDSAHHLNHAVTGAQIDESWEAFLDGIWCVCLRHPTPETIVRKDWLIARIATMLEAPVAGDAERARLREAVNDLDRIERPFAQADRVRFGRPVSRDTYVTAVHDRYPDLFPAERIYHRWDTAARTGDIESLLALYTDDCCFESPLVPVLMQRESGACNGKHDLARFFAIGVERRPNELVRWYRDGRYSFDGTVLTWEYPRSIPGGEQIEIAEHMTLRGGRIAHHRVYWGWFGVNELLRSQRAKFERLQPVG